VEIAEKFFKVKGQGQTN